LVANQGAGTAASDQTGRLIRELLGWIYDL
jgi:hypothetical protein